MKEGHNEAPLHLPSFATFGKYVCGWEKVSFGMDGYCLDVGLCAIHVTALFEQLNQNICKEYFLCDVTVRKGVIKALFSLSPGSWKFFPCFYV